MVVAATGAIFYYDPQIGLLVLLWLPLFTWLVWRYHAPIVRGQQALMSAYARSESHYVDTIQGVADIKLANKQTLFTQLTKRVYGFFQQAAYDLGRIGIRFNLVTELAGALFIVGAITWSAVHVLDGRLSTGGLIVRSLESTDSWTTVFWRSATACAFMLLFLAVRDGRGAIGLFRRMGLPGLVVAGGFACASVSFVVALSLTSVAETLVIMSAAPLFAAILARIFIGEPIRPATGLTIVAVMAGIGLMALDAEGGGSLLGDVFALLATLGIASAIVATRHSPQTRMTPAVCTGTAVAALIALPLATPFAVTAHDAPLLALFGAGQLGLGLVLFVTGARAIPAAQSALIGLLEPVLGPVWVWMAYAERPTAMALVGGVIVVAGVTANTVHDLRRSRRARRALLTGTRT